MQSTQYTITIHAIYTLIQYNSCLILLKSQILCATIQKVLTKGINSFVKQIKTNIFLTS